MLPFAGWSARRMEEGSMRVEVFHGAVALGLACLVGCGDDESAAGSGGATSASSAATGGTTTSGSMATGAGGEGGGGVGGDAPSGSGGDGGAGEGGSGGSGTGGEAVLPENPGPDGLYLGGQGFDVQVTAKDDPTFWGAAPAIDPRYGGTLYEVTEGEMPDPRPDLVDGDQPLRVWVADPRNDLSDRPAIVWLHGGGFAVGIDSMYGLANTDGRAYADRGYVGFSVEYRIDTTVIGGKSLCQWVQDNEDPGDPTWEERKERCAGNIIAAQRDALAFVRWLRLHAEDYGVDASKIAVGGFSAGAVTASNAAYQGDDVGDVAYFEGDDRSVSASRIQAGFGASGCTYSEEGGAPSTIGAGDAPVSFIHSEQDLAVPYACAALTVETARAAGLVAELTSYCDQGGHADELYEDHKVATDTQWTSFLARELRIYSGMAPPSVEPTCD